MKSKAFLLQRLSSFVVFMMIWFEGETITTHKACSARADGVCEKCDGVPQCFDLSDEIDCLNNTINIEDFKQRTPKCTSDRCAGLFPGPPPLPPFSLCSHVQTSTPTATPTAASSGTPNEDTIPVTTHPTKSTHHAVITQLPLPLTTTIEPMSRSTITTERAYTQSTPTPALSSTQWLPTTTVKHEPEFMTVWLSCCTIHYRIEDTLLCVNRYYWCLRTGNCLQPLRIDYASTRPFFTFNNNEIIKNRDVAISKPSERSNEFLKQNSQTSQTMPILQENRPIHQSFAARHPESQAPKSIVPNPVTEKPHISLQKPSSYMFNTNTKLPPLSPKLQPPDSGRKPGTPMERPQAYPQHFIVSPSIRFSYETTTVPRGVTANRLHEPFYTPNFSHDRISDNDLMYALMVLGHF